MGDDSYAVLKVWEGKNGGSWKGTFKKEKRIILDSSAVEHSAVNRRVVGSNPTRGV